MNGAEFEVITVPATNKFTVQHAVSATLGDTAGPDNHRNCEEPDCARQAQNSARRAVQPRRTLSHAGHAYNQESFIASAYTVKEEAVQHSFQVRYRQVRGYLLSW